MSKILNMNVISRIIIATLFLGALAVVAGTQLAPHTPWTTVLGYSAAGALVLLSVLTVGAVLMATIAQWVLAAGGTDVQWYWFGQEPPGLEQLRAQRAAQQANANHHADA